MKGFRNVEIRAYDKNTGKIIEGVPVLCGAKRNPYSKGWVMNSQEALELIAQDKEITGRIHRVLWLLVAHLDFENWIQLSQREICKKLDMKKQDVSSAVKVLERKEIIIRGPKVGRSYSFRLNPMLGWKGDVKNLETYRNKRENQYFREKRRKTLRIDKKLDKNI